MNKSGLLKQILCMLELVHQNACTATARAKDTATNKNNVAENKYDTLGLEAAYLAHGQAQRVVECQRDLAEFKKMKAIDFTDQSPIAPGALIELKDENGEEKHLFLGPAAGGLKFCFEQKQILIVTPSAPLGKAMLGCLVSDELDVNIGGKNTHYEIMAVR